MPLLIGGATTSRQHTAVKIAPGYQQPVVHVQDASRAVSVVGNLLSKEHRSAFAPANLREQELAREKHRSSGIERALLPIETARARRAPIEWRESEIALPSFLGVRSLDDVGLERLVPFIDWTPFFQTWELRGVYPRILDDPKFGERARELLGDAKNLLAQIIEEGLLEARGVYGFFPANSNGDDIVVYRDESRRRL